MQKQITTPNPNPTQPFLDLPISLPLLNTLRSFTHSDHSFPPKFLSQLHLNLIQVSDATQNLSNFDTNYLEKLILSVHYFLSLIINLDQLLSIFTSEPILQDLNIKSITSTNIFNLASLFNSLENHHNISSPDRQYGPRSPLWRNSAVENNKISFLENLRIQVIPEKSHHIHENTLLISFSQLESAMNSQGHLDLQFTINLCAVLNKAFNLTLHHYLLPSSHPQHAKSIAQTHFYTPEAFNDHMLIFTQEDDPKVLYNTLLNLQRTISDCILHQDGESLELLKRLFISLQGHHCPKVREKAVIYLNLLIDGVDWQLESPFKPQISTVDNEFTVSYLLESHYKDHPLILLLNSLPFDKADLSPVMSYHPVEITESSEFCVATCHIGNFPRPGFYDWRIISLNNHGNIANVHAKAQINLHKGLIKEDIAKRVNILAQGRYIVHTKEARKLEIHEIFADNPRGIPGQMYKGSFGKIQEMIPQYNQAGINCLYILGALERDHGAYIDQKTKQKLYKKADASPLAVTCRRSVSSYLGGDEEFNRMMEVAKAKDVKIMVDCVMRISSSRANSRYKDFMLKCVDEDGKFQYAYGAETRGRKHEETIHLNLRRKEVWDLMIEETMAFIKKYGIDGLNLDDAQGWPPVFEADFEEMNRIDTDGEELHSLENRFYGDFIQKDKPTGYWTTEARHHYANPLLSDFCRKIWQKFPHLTLIGENCTTVEHTRTEVSLINSGIIPRMYSFPYAAATLYGKRLSTEGIFHESEVLGVNSFRIWYETFARSLPEGAIIIQSTTHHSWPNPALLFKRGAWSFIDLMFLFPHIPMTFMGELDGYGFRCKTLDMVTHGPKAQNKPCDFTKMEILNGSGVKNTLEDYRKGQEWLVKEVGNDEIFSLKKISGHYKHRRELRKKMEVLRDSELVNLSTGHLEGPLSRVLTYARVGKKETAIISTNFNDCEVFIGIPVQSLKFLLNGIDESQLDSCTIKVYDILGAEFEDYYTAYEFLNGKIDAVLKAHSTLIWSIDVIVDDKHLHAKTLARSMERINQRIARNEAIEGHEVVVMLANIVKDLSNTHEFASNLNYIYKRFLKPTDISLPALFNCVKDIYNSAELSKKLFAFCTLIKDQSPQLSDIQNISQDFNDSCGANIIFDEHQPDSGSQRLPSNSASISSRTSDGISPFEARSKGRKSSESLAESKADDTKTIFDLASEILEHNTLDSIAFITPELGRWSTVGGLGVMVDELSVGLAHLGEHVICISPYYEKNRKGESGYLAKDPDNIRHVFNVEVNIDHEDHILGVHYGAVKGVQVYFLHQPLLFPQPYVDGDASFTMKQMAVMAKASLQIFVHLKKAPSVIVTNDWFTGLTAAYPKQGFFGKFFNKTKFIHIAHNLDQSYEGRLYPSHEEGALEHIHGLPTHLLVNPQWNDLILNPSRCAILSSDQWATVSNAYRKELLEFSPLAPILKSSPKSFAISNGILKTMRFQRIMQVCDNDHLRAKEAIQKKYFKFPRLDNSYAIFGFVGRITQQKGVHLILEAIEQLITLHNGMVQFIIGGMVHKKDPYGSYCADMIKQLYEKYPKNFWADPHEFFTDGTLLNAGCDFGLMPSLFEPGGIVQHEFFIGSTPVIAFQTGGLKDTVFEFDVETNKGNGFLFNKHDVAGFVSAVEKAYQIFSIPEKYSILRKNAFESTIDLDDVAKAWNKEFYGLANKLFFEPKALLPYIDKIDNNLKANELEDKYTLERVAVTELEPEEKGHVIKYKGKELRSQNGVKSTVFTYRHHGCGKPKSVLLVGTFNDWKEPIALRYSREKDVWEVKMQLKVGEYYYKFVVDGNWTCVEDENVWGLYTHTDYKLPVSSEKPADTKQPKDKQKSKQPTDTPFYFNKLKQETKGTTICTPKGYGIIQSIDPEKNTITVKVQGVIYDFDKSEATSEVPISVIYLKESMKTEETVYLPVNSTMKEVFERVESSVNTEENWVDIKVFFQGKELEKTEETLEKLKVSPFSKFLATYTPGKPMSIKRFSHANQGWCVAYSTNIDAIAFQCSKTIRIIGFGVYPITNNDNALAKITLYAGDSVKGQVLCSQEVTVTKNAGEPDSQISKVMFNKPYTVKAGEYASCAISFLVSGNSYYGSGGQVKMDGEGEVTFNFKNCVGANNGTGTSSGQIPEIYYYV